MILFIFCFCFFFFVFFSLDGLTTKTLHLYPFCTWEKNKEILYPFDCMHSNVSLQWKMALQRILFMPQKYEYFQDFLKKNYSDERIFLFLNSHHRPRETLALHSILVKCCKHSGCKTDDAQLLFFFQRKMFDSLVFLDQQVRARFAHRQDI